MHISIDDVKGIFKALEKEQLNSIFETRLLGFLKEMHNKYGTKFDLYCTYCSADYSLENISEKFKDEFMENSNWLRFGFHCYAENQDRECSDYISDIKLFSREIKRITNQTKVPQYLRIHRFKGDYDYCRALLEVGVTYLLTADDGRDSYYLEKKEMQIVNEKGFFYDEKSGISFVKTAFRLERIDDVLDTIKMYERKKYPIISAFTHEYLMDSVVIRKRMETCCKYVANSL